MFVRWDDLTLDSEEQRRLPGYRDEAVVRRFDAPEALQTRFYEVRARSILNRVPEQSRMPFRWTINPYRGCTHACTFCSSGDTLVMRADGRTQRLADLEVGAKIYGTARQGSCRRFVLTRVLDKWSSIKPAFKVTLEDETELITSDDHRFLTARGWKHVIGADRGPLQRPHLTLSSKLLGPGGCVAPPAVDDDYRRGYLCGMVRGDGHPASDRSEQPSGRSEKVQRFRLALTDFEALGRSNEYLECFGVFATRSAFAAEAGSHRAMEAIRPHTRAGGERVGELIEWPMMPSISWMKGYLAGIFDAQGTCTGHGFAISTTGPETLAWTKACLARFGFQFAVEREMRSHGLTCIRLLGGLSERMRFFLAMDPAITRKRTIEGVALKSAAKLRVVDIRPLGVTMRLYDITTGTGDFIADGVVSHNCFARPTHTYLGFNAGRDFEREIVVKVNAPEQLRRELARRTWKREHVALGTNTDPYQWVEGRYRLMEGIWEAMRDAANPCSVLTKSPLLLRDLKLMLQIARRSSFTASLSIPTLSEKAWRETEPHTPNPRARLEAVAELNRAGIPTGVLIAPLMPGINDAPDQVEPLLQAAEDAGATSIGGIALHLRGEVRQLFMDWLAVKRPDLIKRYEELYRRSAYAPRAEQERLSGMVRRRTGSGGGWRLIGQPLATGHEQHTVAERSAVNPRLALAQGTLF
jgi:DNA repair photolyase